MSKNKSEAVAATTLERNADGYGTLPAFQLFHIPEEKFAPGAVVNGYEISIIALIDDKTESAGKVMESWMGGDNNVSAWNPTKPEGDGWDLAMVAEHEEGPFALWARPGVHGVLTGKDYAQEFLLGSMINAATKHLKTLAKPWIELKESEQRRVLAAVHQDCKEAVTNAIDIIASNGRLTFVAAVDQVVFKDGVKAVLTLAKTPEAHSLADAEGSYVTIVIEQRSKLLDEGNSIEPEKDQKPLFDASNDGAAAPQAKEPEAA